MSILPELLLHQLTQKEYIWNFTKNKLVRTVSMRVTQSSFCTTGHEQLHPQDNYWNFNHDFALLSHKTLLGAWQSNLVLGYCPSYLFFPSRFFFWGGRISLFLRACSLSRKNIISTLLHNNLNMCCVHTFPIELECTILFIT